MKIPSIKKSPSVPLYEKEDDIIVFTPFRKREQVFEIWVIVFWDLFGI